jgi:hypothetical protein
MVINNKTAGMSSLSSSLFLVGPLPLPFPAQVNSELEDCKSHPLLFSPFPLFLSYRIFLQ